MIVEMPMPNDHLQMHLRCLNGEDADSIPGIERLWLWRSGKMAEEFGRSEVEFFKRLRSFK